MLFALKILQKKNKTNELCGQNVEFLNVKSGGI